MKIYSKIGLFLMLMLLTFGCQKVELRKETTFTKGLLNFSVSIPGQSTEYASKIVGPFNDGDTIYIEVPTTEEEPIDVTKLRATASLEHNSHLSPALKGIMDFTQPFTFQVTDGEGNTKTHIVKVKPTLPRTTFRKLWFQNAEALGILRTNISGMAVAGDNLLIADFSGGSAGSETVGVRVHDRSTGSFKKVIPAPTTFCMQVVADDAGHFVVNRYNIYSAGFILYYYDNVDSQPQTILNYTAAAGAPVELGKKVSVIGNLKQGKAFVYAAVPNNQRSQIYYWEFNDGVPVDTTPSIISYAGASPWNYAVIQRESLAANSGHYLTYCNYNSNDPDRQDGSRFLHFTPTMDVTPMHTTNHYYKVLDFKVFDINGGKFLAMLTQGYWAWDATHLKVFDITDPNNMALVAESEGYRDFMLFESEAYGGTNYNRTGEVAVAIEGKKATIYASMSTNAAANAGVMAYQMTYNR